MTLHQMLPVREDSCTCARCQRAWQNQLSAGIRAITAGMDEGSYSFDDGFRDLTIHMRAMSALAEERENRKFGHG